ncbi:hydroxylamine oxidase [Thermosulfurimonas marina]|uniref:Hydroxylamine oxidase n=1 Tax=Thermosulfurimonas marina TaxID=2047767 RepID=A0A6H1WPY1_9BACT|nr:multiheme c-type cytochrome [Thermosulfurimonas marina]QJA05275.1 hydroxylamine oxidase [Thermosulfurimonas marina]
MRWRVGLMVFGVVFLWVALAGASEEGRAPLSEATRTCLACHRMVTPGIVADWERSLHAQTTPEEALEKPALSRRISAQKVPEDKKAVAVGCAECHTLNPDSHKDTFDHNDFKVHVVVTPTDCQTCHPQEVQEYQRNLMAKAYRNLKKNPVYHGLLETSLGPQKFEKDQLVYLPSHELTQADACLSCHGTRVEVKGMALRETPMGEMSFPILSGWPNQGVGRINSDGSEGACTSCHPRHSFSIEIARKPYTCAQCHKGPDVPAYKVYVVSKHGNIFKSQGKHWNWKAVPWTVGKDFTAPTCATCHASLLVDPNGTVIAQRTHQFNDRLAWRIFGLIYAHPHPKEADTTIIKNKAGLPLPTELTGEPVANYLIDQAEMSRREARIKTVCSACHATGWVEGFFIRFHKTIETTNQQTLAATQMMLTAWKEGLAQGLPSSIFDEALEKMWVETWLFYANSVRFASAMAGADYGAFANGRWYLNKNLQAMRDWLEFKRAVKKLK